MKHPITFLAILMYTSLVAQIPTAGLVAHYPFCGNANDFSGNALHGAVVGASLTADRFGNPNSAYGFNGISDYIDLPVAAFSGMNVYSYSMWFMPVNNNVSLVYSVGGNDPFCQSLSYNTTSVSAGSYNIGSNPIQSAVFSNPITGINNWIHVAVTRDMTALRMYVNGTLMTQLPMANTNGQAASYGNTAPYKAVLGTRSTLQTYFFGGVIDDARMYSTVLTQNDVTALYNETPASISVTSGTICAGGSFSIQASGAVSYTYPGGSPVVTPTVSSTYTVTGVSGPGCLASAVSSVVIDPVSISVNSGTICTGSSFSIQASGAMSYTYSGGSPVVTPAVTSTYTVTGVSGQGCQAFAVSSVVVSPCTGLAEQAYSSRKLTVRPNPGRDHFKITFTGKEIKKGWFVVEDLQGRIQRNYELSSGTKELEINPDLPTGCYIGRWIIDEQCLSTVRILVSNR